MTRVLVYILMAAGLLMMAVLWMLMGSILPGLALLLLTPLSLYAIKRKWTWAVSASFALIVILSAIAIWRGLPPFLAVIVVLLGLAAWDLDDFRARLALAFEDDNPAMLEQQHITRLVLVLVAGGVLGAISLNVQLTLSFDRLILLVILGVVGLGLLVNALRQRD